MSPSEASDGRRVGVPVLLIRWAQVVAVVGVVLYSSVAAVASYLGGDDWTVNTEPPVVPGTTTVSDGAGTDSTAAATTGDATPATEPVVTEPPATEPPATEPVVTGPPSAANPASVYIVGDSDAGTFGPFLQELLDGTTVASTALNYKTSSGLARPDFFDWPAELSAKLPEVDPDIVVVTFGGNDAQGLRNRDLSWVVQDPVANEDVWTAEYVRQRRRDHGPAARERSHGDLGRHSESRRPERGAADGHPGPRHEGGGRRRVRGSLSSTPGHGSADETAASPSSSSTHATTSAKTFASTTASTST